MTKRKKEKTKKGKALRQAQDKNKEALIKKIKEEWPKLMKKSTQKEKELFDRIRQAHIDSQNSKMREIKFGLST